MPHVWTYRDGTALEDHEEPPSKGGTPATWVCDLCLRKFSGWYKPDPDLLIYTTSKMFSDDDPVYENLSCEEMMVRVVLSL